MQTLKTPLEVKQQNERTLRIIGFVLFCITTLSACLTVFDNGTRSAYAGVIFAAYFFSGLSVCLWVLPYTQRQTC